MANLTITVDEETLRRARMRALARDESVNSYLAEVLRRYAEEDDSAMDAFLAQAKDSKSGSASRGRTWTRNDLHRE